MRYYKKSGFAVNRIECDGEFKFIMDEGSNEMGIEINYPNPNNHVPGSESNNRVIKESFRIAYYQFPYKNILNIMIRHLAMNVTQNLNLFPTNGGVPVHYSLHMILSQRNWDYNKHFKV